MLDDSAVPVLLTQAHLLTTLPPTSAHVMCLDRDRPMLAAQPETTPASGVQPHHLAYVIYTSGSTGQPKGVMVTHHNVVRLLAATDAWFHFVPQDVWTFFHSAAFDFSVWELWGALGYGGRLVVVPYWISRSPHEFYALLSREQVTVLNQTPSAFRQVMAAEAQLAELPPLALRYIIFGGEALDIPGLRPWMLRHGDERPRMINMYGITETTVHVTYRSLTKADLESPASVIGGAIPDLRLYLLDPQGQPVPMGVTGELYVGGAGLARGYLNRPELTAEKFIPNPFGPGLLYRTGDRARWRPDGNLEYLGRLDHQVKLRGFRIELGEIETVLSGHPAVQACVVILREDTPGDRRLVAYVVAHEPDADLRGYLQARLPDYMIPSAFVPLDTLPLTPNGKVDRKALPIPDVAALVSPDADGEPRTATEAILTAIWQEVLHLSSMNIHANFFALGGHSLLATQVVARVRQHLAVDLPLRTLFAHPTVASLAPQVDALRQTDGAVPVSPILLADRTRPLPLAPAQERFWFLDQLDTDHRAYSIPVALRIEGDLDIAALEQALAALVQRHEVLRTVFVVQVILPPTFRLSLVDLSPMEPTERDAEVTRMTAAEVAHPFDLAQGPLFRATLICLQPQTTSVLLLTMHHTITDGWSLEIMQREVTALYAAARQGMSAALPPLALQYADFAVWQRAWLAEGMREDHLAWWRDQLAGAPEILSLPTDRPRPPVQTFHGASHTVTLAPTLSQAVRALSRQQGVTLFTTILAAFQVLLMRESGEYDLVVGVPVANRTRVELEPLIGMFVNTLAIRSHLQDAAGVPLRVAALLAQVQQTMLEAQRHQDVPFEQVVEALQPTRNLSHTPLFQVMCTLMQGSATTLHLPDVQIEVIEADYPIAKFDLTLSWRSSRLSSNSVMSSDSFPPPSRTSTTGRSSSFPASNFGPGISWW